MKAHFACKAFLTAGILFLGNSLRAEPANSIKPTTTVAAEGSGTSRTDSTAGSGLHSGAATNAPATDKQLGAIQMQRERLDTLSAELNELLTKYTEKDKRVRAVRKQIADVQKQLASERAATQPAGGSRTNRTATASKASTMDGDAKAKAKRTNVAATDNQLRAIQKQREQLDALSAQLNELLIKYTEKNPRVRAIRKQIADVQNQLASEPAATLSAEGSGTNKMAKASNSAVNTNTNVTINVGLLTSGASSGGSNAIVDATQATTKTANASANAKSTKAADATARTGTARTNVPNAIAKPTDVTGEVRPVRSMATSGTDVTASRNVSVKPVSIERDDNLNKPVLTASAEKSEKNVDHRTPPPSLSSGAGTNAPASINTSVNVVTMETLDDKHRLAIGDKLSFRIEEDKYRLAAEGDKLSERSEDEPTPLIVTDSGELEVPYIGRFPAENKTCRQLAYELKAALEKDYFYRATVILAVDLKAKTLGRVYLMGAIHVPGPEEIPSDEVLTLGKAILRAGGFTDFAERHNVKVTRQAVGSSGTKTLVVDVAQVFDKGKTQLDLPLEPGDLILVSERLVRF